MAFGALGLLFVVATLLANWFSYDIEVHTLDASASALPSVVHLTAACDHLRDLEATSDDYPDLAADQRAAARQRIVQTRRTVDAELTAYLALPAFAGERELYAAMVPPGLSELDASLSHLLAEVDAGDLGRARVTADREVRAAANRAAGLLRRTVSFNATHAQEDLQRIAAIHRTASQRALLLGGLAVLSIVPVAIWVLRRLRAHDRLVLEHNALIERRASELEDFGQRVAHDLVSPLVALTYCLGAFKPASQGDPTLETALTRARSCVARAQAMVRAMFEFANAGGKPEPGRADLRDALEQVSEEVRAAAISERPEVIVEPFEPCTVSCAPGVLTSILSNLMGNAAKYMSDSDLKRITIRVQDRDSSVGVEIEDTGPGIPRGMERRIFEPYVRAEGATQPGVGLGLATVKRLCEAHGGSVGVRSTSGRGSTFWFSLPKAMEAASAPPVSTARRVS
jgi:signal transduction histidine kinase